MLIDLVLFSNIYLLCSSERHEFCQKEYMNQHVNNCLRLYSNTSEHSIWSCSVKREGSDGTVGTTTES